MSSGTKALDAMVDMADLILRERCPQYTPLVLQKYGEYNYSDREDFVKRCAEIYAAVPGNPGFLDSAKYEFFIKLAERRDQVAVDSWRAED